MLTYLIDKDTDGQWRWVCWHDSKIIATSPPYKIRSDYLHTIHLIRKGSALDAVRNAANDS